MIWAAAAAAIVFFALAGFACFLAGLVDLGRGLEFGDGVGDPAETGTADRMRDSGEGHGNTDPGHTRAPSPILLEHHGELFACRDVWQCIEVSRYLAQIAALPSTQQRKSA